MADMDLYVQSGHICSEVVTFVTIEVKDLNSDGQYGSKCNLVTLVTTGHMWTQMVTLFTIKVRNPIQPMLTYFPGLYTTV